MPNEQHYYRCPECGAKIKHLRYDSDRNEWGDYDIYSEDWEQNGSDTNETTYRCPECDNEIHNLHEIEEWTDEETKPKEKVKSTEKFEVEEDSSVRVQYNAIIKMGTSSEYRFFDDPVRESRDKMIDESTICPKCKNYFITQEAIIECPNCYTEINVREERIKAYSAKEKTIIKIIKNKLHGKRF